MIIIKAKTKKQKTKDKKKDKKKIIKWNKILHKIHKLLSNNHKYYK